MRRLAARHGDGAVWEAALFALEYPPTWVTRDDEAEVLEITLDLVQDPITKR